MEKVYKFFYRFFNYKTGKNQSNVHNFFCIIKLISWIRFIKVLLKFYLIYLLLKYQNTRLLPKLPTNFFNYAGISSLIRKITIFFVGKKIFRSKNNKLIINIS